MSKIIFSDLDGTLLDDNKKISKADMTAIRRAIDAGHRFVIATGRPHTSAYKVATELGLNFKGMYIISFNGAQIYECGSCKVVYRAAVPMDIVHELFDFAHKNQIHIHTYMDGKVASLEHTKEMQWYLDRTNIGGWSGEDLFDRMTEEPCKCIMVDVESRERLEKYKKLLAERYQNKISFTMTCDQYLESMCYGVSKGSAILRLAELLDVPVEDTIGCGDEENDIEMIRAAGVGVAMCNARDTVKEVADYITIRDNNHSAMEEIIEKFVL